MSEETFKVVFGTTVVSRGHATRGAARQWIRDYEKARPGIVQNPERFGYGKHAKLHVEEDEGT